MDIAVRFPLFVHPFSIRVSGWGVAEASCLRHSGQYSDIASSVGLRVWRIGNVALCFFYTYSYVPVRNFCVWFLSETQVRFAQFFA